MATSVVTLAQTGLRPGPNDHVTDVRIAYKGLRTAQISSIIQQFLDTKDPASLKLRSHGTPMEDASTEAKEAIQRIMQCPNEAHATILGVPEGAPEQDVLTAWRKLGCLVQPHIRHKSAADAMIKLCNAARGLGVDWLSMDEVLFWDGETDLNQMDDDSPVEETGEIPDPPERVMEVHSSQDLAIRRFAFDPENKDARAIINHLNYRIVTGNRDDENMKKEKANMFLWTTDLSFFYPQFQIALQNYNIIANDPTNATARDTINKLKGTIDLEIKRKHYPTSWTIPTPDDYLGAKQTIEQIMNCRSDDYDTILGITNNATQDDVVRALETRGRLINPDHVKQLGQAEEAFKRLLKAAEEKGVDSTTIDVVKSWTPEDEDDRPVEEEVPEPPEPVIEVYQTATERMELLKADPLDPLIEESFAELNGKIKQLRGGGAEDHVWQIPVSFFREHYNSANTASAVLRGNPTDEAAARDLTAIKQIIDAKIERCRFPRQWAIISAKEHLEDAKEARQQTISEIKGAAEAAKNASISVKNLLEAFRKEKGAVPGTVTERDIQIMEAAAVTAQQAAIKADITCQAALEKPADDGWLSAALKAATDACTQAREEEQIVHTAIKKLGEATKPANATRPWDYPWHTQETGYGDWIIVGTSKHGKNGRYVLVESMAEGKVHGKDCIPYQKWAPASEVGLLSVEEYTNNPRSKDLGQEYKNWSLKDRGDFKKLLCVTDGRTKLHNSATGGKDVPSKCTVQFKTRGIVVLSTSTFYKVVGETLGRVLVRDLCRVLGFPAPWEREPEAIVYDLSKLGKNKVANFGKRVDHSKPATTEPADRRATTPGNDTTSPSQLPAQENQKMRDVEKRMDQIHATVTAMQGTMEAKMTEMQGKMDKEVTGLKTTMAEATARMNKFEETTSEMKTDITQINANIQAIKDLIARLPPQPGAVNNS
ncbi:hypothetical protein VTK56DRAFT_4848 [Thermocarpiscus australiensis]